MNDDVKKLEAQIAGNLKELFKEWDRLNSMNL